MKPVISEDLKKHMSISPKKDKVYVNAAGEWCNHKDAKYPHTLTRAEILGDESSAPAAEGEGEGEKKEDIVPPVKNTTDAKLKIEVTKTNKKEMPKDAKIGDIVEIDNPDYIDPLA